VQRFKSAGLAQKFLSTHAAVQYLREEAMAAWRNAVAAA
jgi:hypothetical protein